MKLIPLWYRIWLAFGVGTLAAGVLVAGIPTYDPKTKDLLLNPEAYGGLGSMVLVLTLWAAILIPIASLPIVAIVVARRRKSFRNSPESADHSRTLRTQPHDHNAHLSELT